MRIAFELNGEPVDPDVDGDMPLLWLLRDVLDLTGTKYGCGAGLCGACTVHLDDEPVRACQVPAREVEGRRVRSIEGLSVDGDHPLQRAWVELQVPQCGYCQSGQIMAAAALLARHPRPTPGQVDAFLSGNLCRCGTYPRLRAALARASGERDGP